MNWWSSVDARPENWNPSEQVDAVVSQLWKQLRTSNQREQSSLAEALSYSPARRILSAVGSPEPRAAKLGFADAFGSLMNPFSQQSDALVPEHLCHASRQIFTQRVA